MASVDKIVWLRKQGMMSFHAFEKNPGASLCKQWFVIPTQKLTEFDSMLHDKDDKCRVCQARVSA